MARCSRPQAWRAAPQCQPQHRCFSNNVRHINTLRSVHHTKSRFFYVEVFLCPVLLASVCRVVSKGRGGTLDAGRRFTRRAMAVTGEKDVANMARQIAQVTQRDGWKSDKTVVSDMQRLLGKLTTLKVDKDLLQRTKIGAAVNKLKKHDDEVVRGYSASLTKKWKNEVGIAASSSRPPESRRVPSPSPPKRGRILPSSR